MWTHVDMKHANMCDNNCFQSNLKKFNYSDYILIELEMWQSSIVHYVYRAQNKALIWLLQYCKMTQVWFWTISKLIYQFDSLPRLESALNSICSVNTFDKSHCLMLGWTCNMQTDEIQIMCIQIMLIKWSYSNSILIKLEAWR